MVAKYTNKYYWNVVPWYMSWFATRLQFIVYVTYEQERWYYDFFQFLNMLLPPGGQIQKTIWLTPIDFTICHKFAIHCTCKLWRTGMMIFRFFSQFLDILMPPGGQIQKSILLKCSTVIHFMICFKIAIHCVCKLCTGTMILWFYPIFKDVAAPWWPNTEIDITEMLYPGRFQDLPQVCNSLCM